MPWWRLDFWVTFRLGGQVLIKQKVTKSICGEDASEIFQKTYFYVFIVN
jgi:hypothetical protein